MSRTRSVVRRAAREGRIRARGLSGEQASAAAWSVQLAPVPLGSSSASLSRVSCTARNACTAVGGFVPAGESPGSPQMPLVERWNGSQWSIQPIPRLPSGQPYTLTGVSCTSRRACIAVGEEDSFSLNVVERWNGARWSIERLPRRVGLLTGVSCASRTACVAVGVSGFSARLTGTRWSIHQLAYGAGDDDVSCLSATVCTAVGYTDYGNFAARWNGLSWRAQHVPTPDPGDESDALNGVSCASARSCIAVGVSGCGNCNSLATAERWDGTRWADVNPLNPDASGGSEDLDDVSCFSASECIAVGSSTSERGYLLAERWNGTRWALQPTPSLLAITGPSCGPGGCFGALSSVSCTSAAACIAVGPVNYPNPLGRLLYASIVARYS
jgi:hypothetical protein